MKILQISNYFYPHIGGIEQVTRDITRALQGTEQKVFCFNGGKEDITDEVDGVEIIRAGCFAKVASQSLAVRYGKLLKKTFAEFRPEIVVFHYPNPFAAHYLLKLLDAYPDCKLVLWWHLDITKQKILKKLFSGQTERLLKRAVKVVATSPNYIEGSAQLQSVREKTVVIPNCFNESRVAQTEQTRRAAEEIRARYAGKTICFAVGRHIPYKGMEYLIRASKFLDEKYEVLIGGQGELTERLKALASDDGKVRFLGRLSDEDLKAYLLACDIFCFPSITKNEAFGIALAEAMALGKPSVTFTIEGSGVNYVSLNGETGLEVRNGDAEAYAEAIGKLAADGALRARLGAAAEDRARSLFSLDKFCENVKKLTEGLKDA